MRILGIAGSLRRGSHNRRLLRAAGDVLPPGADLVEWEGLGGLPIFDEDLESTPPEPVRELFEAIEQADALLIATPEYNASIPGVLKNAIDWASRPRATTPLQGKPTAVIGATTGSFGAVWAQADARKVLASAGARVIALDLPVAKAHEAFDDAGALHSRDHADRIGEILDALVAEVETDLTLAAA